MLMRYTNITNNSELFRTISNTFNSDFVNLKDKEKIFKIKEVDPNELK